MVENNNEKTPYKSKTTKTHKEIIKKFSYSLGTKLWNQLKGRQLDGFKFRRQQGIEKYVVDFYCPEVMLIVELDGSGHLNPHKKKKMRNEIKN